MADSVFQNLQVKAFRAGVTPRTQESMKWFRSQVKDMRNINRQRLLKDDAVKKVTRPRMGDMYMFYYDPKHKETLPYYDQFPLIVMVDRAPGGFYGLNLHYLPPPLRAKFFDALMDTMSNDRYDDSTRLRARYSLLQNASKLKYFKPCFKHYLTKHVDSRIAKVEPTEWEIALFLPVQRFKKANATQVYKDSRSMI
jgi:hypothetical protein